jgi:hypothetical protein
VTTIPREPRAARFSGTKGNALARGLVMVVVSSKGYRLRSCMLSPTGIIVKDSSS